MKINKSLIIKLIYSVGYLVFYIVGYMAVSGTYLSGDWFYPISIYINDTFGYIFMFIAVFGISLEIILHFNLIAFFKKQKYINSVITTSNEIDYKDIKLKSLKFLRYHKLECITFCIYILAIIINTSFAFYASLIFIGSFFSIRLIYYGIRFSQKLYYFIFVPMGMALINGSWIFYVINVDFPAEEPYIQYISESTFFAIQQILILLILVVTSILVFLGIQSIIKKKNIKKFLLVYIHIFVLIYLLSLISIFAPGWSCSSFTASCEMTVHSNMNFMITIIYLVDLTIYLGLIFRA